MESAAGILVTTPNATDGRQMGNVRGVNLLYVIHLYIVIAKRRVQNAKLIVLRASTDRQEPDGIDVLSGSER
jgi:hypothetical protein